MIPWLAPRLGLIAVLGTSLSVRGAPGDGSITPGRDGPNITSGPEVFQLGPAASALPRRPQHQLVVFNDHQSGGHIFDEGGVDSVGIADRIEF